MEARLGPTARRLEFHIAIEPKDTTVPNIAIIPIVDPVNGTMRMLADCVSSASDIDTAMRLGYRHPMGPLELGDLVGLDVRRDILNNLADSFGDERYRPHPMLDRMVEAGDLGKITGKGIYDWASGEKVER